MFDDPIAKMTSVMLQRLRNPPKACIELNDHSIRHSVTSYLALGHALQNAYDRIIKFMKDNFPGAPGVDNCLKFHAVETFIAAYTGIEPLEHDMCPDSCIGFTGPFADLTECPMCNKSCWNLPRCGSARASLRHNVKSSDEWH